MKALNNKKFKNIINKNGITYFISTCMTYDRGYETMVFVSGYQPDTNDEDEIIYDLINFNDIYQDLYNTFEEAEEGHKNILDKIYNFKEDKLVFNNSPTPASFEELKASISGCLADLITED